MRASNIIIFAVFVIAACGCTAQESTIKTESFHPRYAIYGENSRPEAAAALTPDEAKAILVAQSAGINGSGGGKAVMGPHAWFFEVFTVHDGWYVCYHFGQIVGEKTAHVSRSWKVDQIIIGLPPPEVVAATQPVAIGQ